jgi:hypothetical protein
VLLVLFCSLVVCSLLALSLPNEPVIGSPNGPSCNIQNVAHLCIERRLVEWGQLLKHTADSARFFSSCLTLPAIQGLYTACVLQQPGCE